MESSNSKKKLLPFHWKSSKKVNKLEDQGDTLEVAETKQNVNWEEVIYDNVSEYETNSETYEKDDDFKYCSDPYDVAYRSCTPRQMLSLENLIERVLTEKLPVLKETTSACTPPYKRQNELNFNALLKDQQEKVSYLAGATSNNYDKLEMNPSKLKQSNETAWENSFDNKDHQLEHTNMGSKSPPKMLQFSPQKLIKKVKLEEQDKILEVKKKEENTIFVDKKFDYLKNSLEYNDKNAYNYDRYYCSDPNNVPYRPVTPREAISLDKVIDNIITEKIATLTEAEKARVPVNKTAGDIIYVNRKEIEVADPNHLAQASLNMCSNHKQKRPLPAPRNNRQLLYKKNDQYKDLEKAVEGKSSNFEESIHGNTDLPCLNTGHYLFHQEEEKLFEDHMHLQKNVPVNKDISHSKKEIFPTCQLQKCQSLNWNDSEKENLLRRTLAENEFLKSKIEKAMGELKKKATLSYFPDESEVNLFLLRQSNITSFPYTKKFCLLANCTHTVHILVTASGDNT